MGPPTDQSDCYNLLLQQLLLVIASQQRNFLWSQSPVQVLYTQKFSQVENFLHLIGEIFSARKFY